MINFSVSEFPKVLSTKQVRWEIKPLLMAYLLSINCTKNQQNRTAIVKDIVHGWEVYFFAAQCILSAALQLSTVIIVFFKYFSMIVVFC